MPLIVITGIPSSGKTKLAFQLKSFLEKKSKRVKMISENEVLNDIAINKNDLYSDAKKEKELRSIIKSQFVRYISPDEVVIIDSLNYIKGYRYELFCACKSAKTTQCTVYCLMSSENAWKYNLTRDSNDRYDRQVFEELVQRYEEPIGTNRWDSPLFTFISQENDENSFIDIYEALYSRKPAPPNQSTQCLPLSDSNFLYELDQAAQDVIKTIIEAKKLNLEGEIKIPNCSEVFILSSEKNTSLAELTRMKRQFLSYVKLQPVLYSNKNLASLFLQYLNSNL